MNQIDTDHTYIPLWKRLDYKYRFGILIWLIPVVILIVFVGLTVFFPANNFINKMFSLSFWAVVLQAPINVSISLDALYKAWKTKNYSNITPAILLLVLEFLTVSVMGILLVVGLAMLLNEI